MILVLISFAKAPIARKCTEFSDSSASDALRSYALLLGGDEADAAAPMPRACNLYCEMAERKVTTNTVWQDGIKSYTH